MNTSLPNLKVMMRRRPEEKGRLTMILYSSINFLNFD
jgi:hypothetical protein